MGGIHYGSSHCIGQEIETGTGFICPSSVFESLLTQLKKSKRLFKCPPALKVHFLWQHCCLWHSWSTKSESVRESKSWAGQSPSLECVSLYGLWAVYMVLLYIQHLLQMLFKAFLPHHCGESTLSLLIGEQVFWGREHVLLFDSKVWHTLSSLVCVTTSVMLKRCLCRCLQTARAVGFAFTEKYRESSEFCVLI